MGRRNAGFGAALAVVIAVNGCGGGGGGGNGDGGGSPSAAPSVRLDAGNRLSATDKAVRGAESVLLLGQWAANSVALLARNGSGQVVQQPCTYEGGTARYTLTDVDRNGVISAGDRIIVEYERCGVAALSDVLGDVVEGTATIHVTVVDDAARGVVSGTIDFGDGLGHAGGQGIFRTFIYGSMTFRRSVAFLEETMTVDAAPADDLRHTFVVPEGSMNVRRTDIYRRPALTRVMNRQAAQVSVGGTMRLESEALGGSVDVRITQPLVSKLNSVPFQGRVEVTGASGSRLTLSALDSPGTLDGRLSTDADGDGRDETSQPLRWSDVAAGYVSSFQNGGSYMGEQGGSALFPIHMPGDYGPAIEVDAPLQFQFNQPLRADMALYARIVDQGDGAASLLYAPDPNPLDADPRYRGASVEVRGAVLLIRPAQPLRHGRRYMVQLSGVNDFESPAPPRLEAAASGVTPLTLNSQVASFEADDLLWLGVRGAGAQSMVLPGRDATLQAGAPKAMALPLRFQWMQVDGPAVTFGSPNAASTSVHLAGVVASGIGQVRLAVTVTDAIGRQATAPVVVQVADPAGLSTFLFLADAPGDRSVSETHAYSSQTGAFWTYTNLGPLEVRYEDVVHSVFWVLRFAAPGGDLPTVGRYTNTVSPTTWPPVDAPGLGLSGYGRSCDGPGAFEVLELAMDEQGHVARVAVDFDVQCPVGSATARGSLRINSSIPVRR